MSNKSILPPGLRIALVMMAFCVVGLSIATYLKIKADSESAVPATQPTTASATENSDEYFIRVDDELIVPKKGFPARIKSVAKPLPHDPGVSYVRFMQDNNPYSLRTALVASNRHFEIDEVVTVIPIDLTSNPGIGGKMVFTIATK